MTMTNFYYPRRIKSLMNGQSASPLRDSMRLRAYWAFKASVTEDFIKELDVMKKAMNNIKEGAGKYLANDDAKSQAELTKIVVDNHKIMSVAWQSMHKAKQLFAIFSGPEINNPQVLKDVEKYLFLNRSELKNPLKDVNIIIGIGATAFDQYAKLVDEAVAKVPSYYGMDKDRYQDPKERKKLIKEYRRAADLIKNFFTKFIDQFPSTVVEDIQTKFKKAQETIPLANKLASVLSQFDKILVYNEGDNVGELGNKINSFFDTNVVDAYGEFITKATGVFPEHAKLISENINMIESAASALLSKKVANDPNGVIRTVNTVQKIANATFEAVNDYIDDIQDPNSLQPIQKRIVFDYIHDSLGELDKVQEAATDLTAPWPEVQYAMPKNLYLLWKIIDNPPPVLNILDENQVKDKVEVPYKNWALQVLSIIDDWAGFAELFEGVKSLYPIVMAMRSTGTDSRGRDMEYVKYVEAMNSLLNEALSGKSLTANKSYYLGLAAKYFPKDQKVSSAAHIHKTVSVGNMFTLA